MYRMPFNFCEFREKETREIRIIFPSNVSMNQSFLRMSGLLAFREHKSITVSLKRLQNSGIWLRTFALNSN